MKPEVKDYAYYSDLYDQGTVNHARYLSRLDKKQVEKKLAKIKDENKKKRIS